MVIKTHKSSWTRENKENHTTETSYKMKDETFNKIRTIIADITGFEADELVSSLSISDDLNLDKWGLTEISQTLEIEFDIVIDDEDATAAKTLGQYVDIIAREISKS